MKMKDFLKFTKLCSIKMNGRPNGSLRKLNDVFFASFTVVCKDLITLNALTKTCTKSMHKES